MDAKPIPFARSSQVLIKHKTFGFGNVLAPRYRTTTFSFSKGEYLDAFCINICDKILPEVSLTCGLIHQ